MANEMKIYKLKDEYCNLNETKKKLIDEVIRFCKEQNKFPSEHDMRNKKGYISSSTYKNEFGKFTNIYDYIERVDKEKPEFYTCHRCGIEKEFNEINFGKAKMGEFGFNKICKCCKAEYGHRRTMNKIASMCSNNEINIIEIYENFIENKSKAMPTNMYTDKNVITIIKYVFYEKLKITNKLELMNNYNLSVLKQHRLLTMVYRFGDLNKSIGCIFTEYEFTPDDFILYDDITVNNIIKEYIEENNLTVQDLLEGKFNYKTSKKVSALLARIKKTINNTLIWYCERNNILHPVLNCEINNMHFSRKSTNYWNEETTIENVKYYCETLCEQSIIECFNDTNLLRKWIEKYFTTPILSKHCNKYHKYFDNIYGLLVAVYPHIKENKILFEWEWTQCNIVERDFLIVALRNFVLYRINNHVKNIKNDLPIYLHRTIIKEIEPKLHKHIDRKRFSSYFEWACLAFPEYQDYWKLEDFEKCVAFDGARCDSKQELMIYEYIKKNDVFSNLKYMGNKHSGNHIFKAEFNGNPTKFCPDFIVEELNIRGKVFKLTKPIIIEHFGMYEETHINEIYINYRHKTKAKIEHYSKLEDYSFIYFIAKDIKNDFEGVKIKLCNYINECLDLDEETRSFLMQKIK